MRFLKAFLLILARPYARARDVRGGSGHFNEQCHPQTYG
jgi:hypothetical protein